MANNLSSMGVIRVQGFSRNFLSMWKEHQRVHGVQDNLPKTKVDHVATFISSGTT